MTRSSTAQEALARATELYERGNESVDSLRYFEAVTFFRLARDAFMEVERPHSSIEYARCLANLALSLDALDEHDEARDLYEASLTAIGRYERHHPTDRLRCLRDRVGIMTNLAGILCKENRLAEAEALFRQALEQLQEVPDSDLDRARTALRLSEALVDQEHLVEAERFCRESLAVFIHAEGCEIDLGRALSNLGVIEMEQGDLPASVESFRRALHYLEGADGSGADHACALNNLGNAHRKSGRLSDSELAYRDALRIFDQIEGAGFNRAYTVQNLALTTMEQGRWETSEELFTQALHDYATLGVPAAERARTMMNLAMVQRQQDRSSQAEIQCREALDLLDNDEGPQSLVGTTWLNLANTLKDQDRLADAEDGYRRALQEFAAGEAGLDNQALTVLNLAVVVADQGRYPEAAALFAQARRWFNELGMRFETGVVDYEEAQACLRVSHGADNARERSDLLRRAQVLSVEAARDAEHRRFQFPDEEGRVLWINRVAQPSMDFALQVASEAGDAALIGELVATWRMAGTVSASQESSGPAPADRPWTYGVETLQLSEAGSSLLPESLAAGTLSHADSSARIRRSAGPRLSLPFRSRIALGDYSASDDDPGTHPHTVRPVSRYR